MRVTMANGQIGQGSGFFGVESGLVLTNAHVLGMLNDDDLPPRKVEIVYHSGEADSRAYVGKILGVDRASDLAVLRVEGNNLPEPLTVKASTGLIETQTVYIVGFPFGDKLGRNITVSQTSVSSLRAQSQDGVMDKVQVNGGMHPGNSGGPVINSSGEVVGVAVSGIQGTQIHFAVPGEYVGVAMNGRVTTIASGATVKDGEQVKMRVLTWACSIPWRASRRSTWNGGPALPAHRGRRLLRRRRRKRAIRRTRSSPWLTRPARRRSTTL